MIMNKLSPFFILIASVIAISCISCNKNLPADYLREGFMNPPDSARPGVYWYFMDGNIDRDAITTDLESMKVAGLGYVVFLEVNVGVPRGKVDFLSEEWKDLFTHAVREAERLGIRIILGSGPGWAGSGGPWVSPSKSMLHLVASDTTLTGPCHFEGRLAVPPPRTPFFGEGSLNAELKQLRDEWYKDVSILAFPAPEVQEMIADIDEKALYYRAPFTSQKGVLPYLREPAGLKRSDEGAVSPEKIINRTDRMQTGGILEWEVPPGKWTVMRFVERNNGAVTRPAPVPGLGFECDKLDRAAMDEHYNEFTGKLIEKSRPVKVAGGGGWTMIHIDSWESGSQNWSPLFRQEFIQRRGYDPISYLPVYKGYTIGSPELSERFLWDLRQTAAELLIEKYFRLGLLGKSKAFIELLQAIDSAAQCDVRRAIPESLAAADRDPGVRRGADERDPAGGHRRGLRPAVVLRSGFRLLRGVQARAVRAGLPAGGRRPDEAGRDAPLRGPAGAGLRSGGCDDLPGADDGDLTDPAFSQR